MAVNRSISAASSQLSSYHCTCPCHKDRQQSALSAFNSPVSSIIPPHFKLGRHGTTRISWSRYNTPKTREVASIINSPRNMGVSVTSIDLPGYDSEGSKGSGVSRYTGRHVRPTAGSIMHTGQRSISDTSFGSRRSSMGPGSGRMGKTITETATRVFTKDGKRYQETVETVTREDDDGNVTKTTKTTTKELDPFGTKELSAAIEHPKSKTSRGASRKSSTSSSDSSPDRKGAKSQTKTKPTEKSKSGKSGLMGKIKSKTLGGDKSSDSDSSDEEEFIEEVHRTINEHRKKHGVKPLKLSKEINKHAKEWAKKLAADEKLAHRPDNKYGENVYCVSSNSSTFKIKGKEVTDKWYSEIKDHVFGEEPKGSLLKSGHFSQMIWKDSKQVGIGYARSATGTKIFVVANFDPQGNWLGQFATQVPPVGGFSKTASKEKSSLPATAKATTAAKSSSSSSSSDSSEEGDFAEECLKAHNNYRKKHGVPALKLNKELSKFAKEWAQTIAKKNVLQHRDNNKYGENIYCAWSSNPNHKIKGSEAVESWYSEIKDYTFGKEPFDLRAGHFTQVVWQDSKELGVGYARSPTGKIFVVANYNPAGNFVGSFATKVPRPK
ncbi:uncharacterized protein LOC135196370 isoform X2 [Macrobrachium nipponense]|uniref:uncharacterized protein LOC135196370 isoform X2 n=1 Tax=Macrobrachium nipponense TaxID=159736 RepID=UPI0030C862C4